MIRDFGPIATLDWTSLDEGVYTLEVTVRNRASGEVVGASTSFELVPQAEVGPSSPATTQPARRPLQQPRLRHRRGSRPLRIDSGCRPVLAVSFVRLREEPQLLSGRARAEHLLFGEPRRRTRSGRRDVRPGVLRHRGGLLQPPAAGGRPVRFVTRVRKGPSSDAALFASLRDRRQRQAPVARAVGRRVHHAAGGRRNFLRRRGSRIRGRRSTPSGSSTWSA
jgi:hypothetical protein